jgi:hypothetical protein
MVEINRIFSLSPSEHLRIKDEIDDTVDPAKLNYINVDDLVNESNLEMISCGICEGVAHDPVQDESCQQLFCRYCITNALKTDLKCPITGCPGDAYQESKRIGLKIQ